MSRKAPPPPFSSSKSGAKKKNDDAEQALLASLGSSVQNMDQYEEDVLRTAEYDSVPKLTGIGFPDGMNQKMVTAPLSQVANMQTVLGRLRDEQLRTKPHNLKFLLKQQMLLNLLHTTTKDPELCVRAKEEIKLDQERRKRFRNQVQRAQTAAKSTVAVAAADIGSLIDPGRNGSRAKKAAKAPPPPKSVLKKRNRPGGDDNDADDDNDESKKSAGDRLEDIKKGRKSVSFAASGSSSDGIKNKKNKRPRVGIQKRKNIDSNNGNNHDGGMDEEDFQKHKEHLLKLRKEREERRRRRRKQWGDTATTHSTRTTRINATSAGDDDADEEEAEFQDDVDENSAQQPSSDAAISSTEDSSNNLPETSIKLEQPSDATETTTTTTTTSDLDPDAPDTMMQSESEETAQAVDDNIPETRIKMEMSDDAETTATDLEADTSETTIQSESVAVSQTAATVKQEPEEDNSCPIVSPSGAGRNGDQVAVPPPPPPPPPPSDNITTLCPLCRTSIQAVTQESLDEALSAHMQLCGNTRTRGQRRSARARTVVNYAENDKDPMEEDIIQVAATARPSKRATRSTKKKVNNKDGRTAADEEEEEPAPIDVYDEDEELQVDADAKDEPLDVEPSLDDTVPMTRARARLPIDDWDEDEYEDRVDDWIEHGIQDMRVMKERDANEKPPGEEVYDGGLVVPAWINDRLFPYQRTALQWMWELHRQQAGGIIGDEMGLGKTVQICAYLGSMVSSRKMKSALIISPATMLQHWLKEIAKWAPGLRRILIHQSSDGAGVHTRVASPSLLNSIEKWLKRSRKTRLFEAIDEDDLETRDPATFCGTGYVFVTTYENVRRNPEIWINHNWSYIVMDEAQKIRNPDADVTLVCKRLKTPHRLALSGTPIQNDLRELWSLFDFVFPGRLGTLPAFEHEFADPIKRGGYSNASPMQVQLAYRCALILRDLINPYLLRRLKKDIKEVNRMPGKKEQVLFCRLSDKQRTMYESFLQSDQVKGVMRGSVQLLGAITMLRKICNHPDLVCPPDQASFDSFLRNGFLNEADLQGVSDDDGSVSEEQGLTERSGKLEVLAKILPLWKEQGHRVLIFCQWKKMLDIIQRFTELQGWKFGRLDGNTNVASRQRLVDNFNEDESYYGMLCTTRTGGVGLNLTGADRIILYDPDWNPQTDAQARERAWRFGQEREVTVYRLIAAGTVEEKIYHRQIFKTALSNSVLQDPRQRRLFSQKDLKDLFSLKADSGSVIEGGDGATETTELTKGDGYIDPDEAHDEMDDQKSSKNDDGETLRTVFQSQGLAGVFDHDVVEQNKNVAKKTSVREMEAKAKKIARQALHALEDSVVGGDTFTPTWTGSDVSQGGSGSGGGRFGGGSQSGNGSSLFGGKGLGAGVQVLGNAKSSNSLLASIRQRDESIKTLGKSDKQTKDMKHYTQLLKRIRNFVKQHVPTSEEIIDEFSSVSNYDAAVFRRLLKSVAVVEKGRWRLKQR